MIFRVTYPLISQDAHRDFATREEAEAFARARREVCNSSPLMTRESWRLVTVREEVA